ncbi:hypothetical protein C8J48_1783 [Desmospora activa DSM 45169]|uniref:Uncharacterized protein n=1 Tax=Desmospora activa DSM 45169 TaxID=1121389 RepID=A0A2T4ZBB6_9BACL|nr:hypothetical protein C8J48_1783 [Desmospora activa DSM 45169]
MHYIKITFFAGILAGIFFIWVSAIPTFDPFVYDESTTDSGIPSTG